MLPGQRQEAACRPVWEGHGCGPDFREGLAGSGPPGKGWGAQSTELPVGSGAWQRGAVTGLSELVGAGRRAPEARVCLTRAAPGPQGVDRAMRPRPSAMQGGGGQPGERRRKVSLSVQSAPKMLIPNPTGTRTGPKPRPLRAGGNLGPGFCLRPAQWTGAARCPSGTVALASVLFGGRRFQDSFSRTSAWVANETQSMCFVSRRRISGTALC